MAEQWPIPSPCAIFTGLSARPVAILFFSQVAPPLELEHPGQRLSQNDLYFGFGHLPQAARYEFLAPLSVPPKLKAVRGRFVLLSPFLSFEQNFRTYLSSRPWNRATSKFRC